MFGTYEIFGNGAQFRRPGGPMDTQTLAKYAMAGSLAGLLVVYIANIRGIG